MLEINVNNDFLEQQKDIYGATEKQFDTARFRALRKIQKRIETDLKRQAAHKLRLPQKAIGKRFFSNRITPGDDELQVWIGTWNISPYGIGTPRQLGSGVRVGQRSFPGAFLGKIYSSTEKVWIRLHSQHYSPDLYPTKYRPGDRGVSELRGRFPVVRAAVPIDGVMQDLIDTLGDDYAKEFETIFIREMNYETQLKGQM